MKASNARFSALALLLFLLGSLFAATLHAQTPCAFTISPSSGSHNAGTSTGLVSVTTSAGCAWSVANTNGWITFLSGSNGIGNGIVSYRVSPNPSTSARAGYLLIGDQSFAVTQLGGACSFALSPADRTSGPGPSTNSVSLTTSPDCSWTVVNRNDWINILSDANNTGSGTVIYSLPDHPATWSRTGFILIAGRMFTITQTGVLCNYSVLATNRSYGASATNDIVEVSAATICSWEVGTPYDWITILSPRYNSGPGLVTYALTANPGPYPRIGEIYIAGLPPS